MSGNIGKRTDAEIANYMAVKDGRKSRWFELFGTPERAARTLALQCFGATSDACDTCVFGECDGKLRNSGTYPTVYDTLLEWLRGDA